MRKKQEAVIGGKIEHKKSRKEKLRKAEKLLSVAMVSKMIELSGREITGVKKMSERSMKEFKALIAAVDACGQQDVRLNLTDLNITTLWRKNAFIKLAMRPNLTLILDPETASVLSSYLMMTGGKAKYEVKELEAEPEKEDPSIQELGEEYASSAYIENGFICFNVRDTGWETVNSIGLSALGIRRAVEIISRKAAEMSLKLLMDFSDVPLEGGSDLVLALALVECRKRYKLPIKVAGEGNGIAEYVRVAGNVKLPAEAKVPYFKRILPDTVMRLCTYQISKADITGRKGSGKIAGTVFVLFRGVEGTDALYDEIPTQQLYLPEDLEVLGEVQVKGDIRIPRRRNLAELGLQNICTGSHGHFGPIAKDKVYQISDGRGGIREVSETYFVARGLEALGLAFN